MNADHSLSLGHYLEYLAHLPRSQAYKDPKIVSFKGEAMVLEYGAEGRRKRFEHRWTPVMGPGEARGRLVELHHEAKKALGISDVTLNYWTVSPLALLCVLLLFLFELWLILLPSSRAGQLFWWHAPVFNPLLSLFGYAKTRENLGFAVKAWWTAFMVVTHLWEIPTALEYTLRRYNITSKRLRVAYSLLTFIGGFTVWTSIRRAGHAEEQKLAGKGNKH
ncbi:hypothetical protein JCM11251_007432 [Rhodosporidiobolus azoricus]